MPRRGRLAPAATSLLCGAALALCLPKPGLCPVAWFVLSPWLKELDEAEGGFLFLFGWLCGLGYFGVSLYWIFSTCRFAQQSIPVALLAWGALTGFLALDWGVFGLLSRRIAQGCAPWARAWAVAAAWTAVEFAGARFTPRLSTDVLGYTQWRYLSLIQGSAWAGPHALGFLIMLSNATLVSLWRDKKTAARSAIAAAIASAAWTAYGAYALATRTPPSAGARVALIQPNIDQYRKWEEVSAADIRKEFDPLLEKAAQARPSLVVWPETALPGWLEDADNLAWVTSWAVKSATYHLVGVVLKQDDGAHNAAVLLGPDGRTVGAYYKRQLVPFGEFVPLRHWLAPYIGILNQFGDFAKGRPVQAPLAAPVGPLGVTICYEAMFPYWNRLTAAAGASVIANITNDGWYKDTWGPHQHFQANVFRAVENRVTFIRSGNTGISAVIDPYGVILARKELLDQGVLLADLPAKDPFPARSFYARHGDWFGWCALAATAACVLLSWFRRI